METTIVDLRGRIAAARVKRSDIAALLGMHISLFSRYLNEERPAPAGFEASVSTAIHYLVCAEKAAQQTHKRVLSQCPPLSLLGSRSRE